jgi:hypothetical protein
MAVLSKIIVVNDKMQRGYRYTLTAPMGRYFDPKFCPDLTPREMLALGVFCGNKRPSGIEVPIQWPQQDPSRGTSRHLLAQSLKEDQCRQAQSC